MMLINLIESIGPEIVQKIAQIWNFDLSVSPFHVISCFAALRQFLYK